MGKFLLGASKTGDGWLEVTPSLCTFCFQRISLWGKNKPRKLIHDLVLVKDKKLIFPDKCILSSRLSSFHKGKGNSHGNFTSKVFCFHFSDKDRSSKV